MQLLILCAHQEVFEGMKGMKSIYSLEGETNYLAPANGREIHLECDMVFHPRMAEMEANDRRR
jgi:hypothetical protein